MKAISLSPIFRKVVFWLVFAFVTAMTLMPYKSVEASFSPETRSLQLEFHALAYFAMASAAMLAFVGRKFSRVSVFFMLVIYGGVLELLQTAPLVNRSCEVKDFAMNSLGAALGVWLFPLLMRLAEKGGFQIGVTTCVLALAAGCVIPATNIANMNDGAPARAVPGKPQRIVAVKMQKQLNEGYCAPATLASLLNHHGITVTQELIAAGSGSTEKEGTDVARLLAVVSERHLPDEWVISPVLAPTYARGEKIISRYNALADAAGKKKLPFPTSGRLVFQEVFAGADIKRLRESVTKSDRTLFKNAIAENITAGCPLVWGVILGVAPEPSVLYSTQPAGHLRLITGYSPFSNEIFYADTWGATNPAPKSMSLDDALAITISLHSMRPKR